MAFIIEDHGNIDLIIGKWGLGMVPTKLKKHVTHDYEFVGQFVKIFEVRQLWQG